MTTPSTVGSIIDNIRRVFQVMHEQSRRVKRVTGITGPQLWAMKSISEHSPIRVSDLARRMYLHPATIVGIIDRLEKQDLVKRTRSQVDRRVVQIELTTAGKALASRSPEVAQGTMVRGLEALSDRKKKQIMNSLDMLVNILGAQDVPPQLILSPEVNAPKRAGRRSRS